MHGVPALLSLVVPGLGQAAKGQYLRALLVWLAMGLTVYFVLWLRPVDMVVYAWSKVLGGDIMQFSSSRWIYWRTAEILEPYVAAGIVWCAQVIDAYRTPVRPRPTMGGNQT
jgi:hypothetical protein